MNFFKLLTTDVAGNKVVVDSGSMSVNIIDGRWNIDTQLDVAHKVLMKQHKLTPHIIGYALYSGGLSAPQLESWYTFPKYEHMERNI